jgi:RNA 2',3'-cyclic 3'-phosphodiesterase
MTSTGSVEGDERLRLFLGFRLPDHAARDLADWQLAQLEVEGVRIVPVENLHVTIAFLGSRPASEIEAIGDALRGAVRGIAQPVLTPAHYRETRSVGMLVLQDEESRAARIAKESHDRLAELGVYEPEQRPWLPHLTVVRFRRRPRLQPTIPAVGPMRTSDAAVYISRLRPTGAQYEVVESVPLGGG